MPPAQKRNVDDSRSETSSIITSQKDTKGTLGPSSGAGITKAKRATASAANGATSSKAPTSTAIAPTSAPNSSSQSTEKDPGLPKIDWTSTPNTFLRTYRIAHRLPVPSTFSHPHADILYKSSHLALRTPSAIAARRKFRDQRRQKRKLENTQGQANGFHDNKSQKPKPGRSKDKSSTKDSHSNSSTSLTGPIAQSIEPPDPPQETSPDGDQSQPHAQNSPHPALPTYLGPREQVSALAATVRKHFNAQQISEADTIARFTYVMQQTARPVWTEGADGDGAGHLMGSQGREVKRGDGPGGEVGFRLRFRP